MIRGAFHRLFAAAFTLIELLVVISIITLLLSIFIPALSMARQQGRSVVCLSNLRQMSIAANAYTEDNNGFFPLAFYYTDDFSCPIREWDFFKIFENGEMKECTPGFLWQGQGIMKIQQCPSFKGYSNSEGDPYTGYNYNSSFVGGWYEKFQGNLVGCNSSRIGELKRPYDCAFFGDGQIDNGANKFMRSPQAGKLDKDSFSDFYRFLGAQGYRHIGRTNVAYGDGSAASVKEVFTNTASGAIIEEYNTKNKVKIGFLSSDNSAYDLQ